MKTLQIKTGRWYAIIGKDGDPTYCPMVPGRTTREMALMVDATDPPVVTEVMGTGLRLYDDVAVQGEDWKVCGNNAQALSAAAFRIRETA